MSSDESGGVIVFTPPTGETRGHFRRRLLLLELEADIAELEAAPQDDPATKRRLAQVESRKLDLMASFAVVSTGVDPREALLDLSRDEFDRAWASMRGDAPRDPLASSSAPPSSAASPVGSKAKAKRPRSGR